MKKLKNLHRQRAIWALPFVLIFLLSILQFISIPVTFILFFSLVFILALRPVYDIYQMDFNLCIDNLELNDLFADLID